ncbi:UNVERIFIED_CONTAM: hypothetical protein FKN15_069808 [Acipenser sinensis]
MAQRRVLNTEEVLELLQDLAERDSDGGVSDNDSDASWAVKTSSSASESEDTETDLPAGENTTSADQGERERLWPWHIQIQYWRNNCCPCGSSCICRFSTTSTKDNYTCCISFSKRNSGEGQRHDSLENYKFR